jgi:dihydrofolate synthase/folylpolyglutamate synthase
MGNVEWLEALSPWPSDGFGTERMRALLAEVGDPQLAYPAIHVVGTNGKSTTSRMIEALLAEAGLRVGTYLSPHVRGWEERIRVDGDEVDFERALGSVREACERLGATQFETLTAAAFVEFAEAAVDVAVVEAGLGGRHDATNVLDSRVVVLTNVALDHTDVLGETREAIAAEKLAVVHEGATVVIGEPEWEPLARSEGARDGGLRVVPRSDRRPSCGRRRLASWPPRASRRGAARDLGRRSQHRGHRLAPAAAAEPKLGHCLLDPGREAPGQDAPSPLRPRRHVRRHHLVERPRTARRGAFAPCFAVFSNRFCGA